MKRNKLLLVALILGVAYLAYSLWYWFGGGAASAVGSDSASQAGAGIATMLVTPHLLLTVVAVIFNALAFFMSKRAFALVAGILYAVAMVLFIAYALFLIVQMVLCFVAYAKMPKKAEA